MFIKKIFRHIWPIIMKYKLSFFATFVFFAFAVFLDYVLKTLYLKHIIDIISSGELVRSNLEAPLMHLVLLTAITLAGVFVFNRLATWTHCYFKNNVLRELSDYSFQKITEHSYVFFSNHFTGGLVSKSKRFTNAFRSMSNTLFFNFWNTFIITFTAFIVLFREVPKIAGAFMLWVVFFAVVMYRFTKVKFKYDLLSAAADSRVGGRLSDVFTNIFALKVFSARETEINSFKEITLNEAYHRGKNWDFANRQRAVKGFLMISVQVIMLYFSLNLWLAGMVSTGTIVLIQAYMLTIISRLWDLDDAMVGFMESVSEMSEAIDLFEIKPDILDPENPEVSRMKDGSIEFKNVSFLYESGKDVFENFSLQIKPGERIGLVGHSGAGKSTITKLLLRFVDVSGGEVLIDGQNIKKVLQNDLRRSVAYVPQEPILFHRTIRENIAYGKPEATLEEVISAAKRAYAHEFISTLQQGYDTLVGERGVKLSGGERQRIAIARVMLTSAPILILDEATSSLDSVSENYIQDAFSELMKGRTAIVIAHRLSTIKKMDRIIVLENGAVVEEGTHRDLLVKNGIYADLWKHQTGGFLQEENL